MKRRYGYELPCNRETANCVRNNSDNELLALAGSGERLASLHGCPARSGLVFSAAPHRQQLRVLEEHGGQTKAFEIRKPFYWT